MINVEQTGKSSLVQYWTWAG